MSSIVAFEEGKESVASVLLERHHKAAAMVQSLSRRETQVLDCLVDGCVTKEIANRIGLSPRTVEIYRSRLLRKLQVRTSLAAACIGAYAGLGDFDHLRPVADSEPIEIAAPFDPPA